MASLNFKTSPWRWRLLLRGMMLGIVLTAITIGTPWAPAAAADRRVALVVGMSGYQAAPALANPVNDARAFADVLKRLGFDVDLAVDVNKADLEQAVHRLAERADGAALEVRQMLSRVRQAVRIASRGAQVPWDNSSLIADVYLAPEAPGLPAVTTQPEAPAPERPAVDQEADLLFWRTIETSNNPADFRDYLRQFPGGRFISLAQRRVDDLDRSLTVASVPPVAPTAPAPTLAPPVPMATAPGPTIAPLDRRLTARHKVNVRVAPNADSDRLAILRAGTSVQVTGKVVDADWYRVTLPPDQVGYVSTSLLGEPGRSGTDVPQPGGIALAP